jgi:hypothetical protein
MAAVRRHFGWMRDLRSEKVPPKPPAPPPAEADGAKAPPSPSPTSRGQPFADIDETVDAEPADENKSGGAPEAAQLPTQVPTEEKAHGASSEGVTADESKGGDGAASPPPSPSPAPRCSKGGTNDDDDDDAGDEGEDVAGVRLALLPDFRSRALWLSALVDPEGVCALVTSELQGKLREILEASPAAPAKGSDDAAAAQTAAARFCLRVTRGVRAAAASIDAPAASTSAKQ